MKYYINFLFNFTKDMEDLFKTSKELDLIRDGDINYLVMNEKDNRFTLDWFEKANDILDQVEGKPGPGVLVTVGTGPKIFHTGFNLENWKNDPL